MHEDIQNANVKQYLEFTFKDPFIESKRTNSIYNFRTTLSSIFMFQFWKEATLKYFLFHTYYEKKNHLLEFSINKVASL